MKTKEAMRAIGALCLFILLYQNVNVFAQQKTNNRNPESLSKCRYGFAAFLTGHESVCKITPAAFDAWKRIIAYNFTIPELYAIAYSGGSTIPNDKFIFNVQNPEKLATKVCYELNAPPELADNIFVLMRQHIEYEFPEYTALITIKNGENYLVVTDKENGILITKKPILAKKPSEEKSETTYQL